MKPTELVGFKSAGTAEMLCGHEEFYMKISTKVQYGLRAMVYLAGHSAQGKPCTVKEISACESIPFDYLGKIIETLEKAGLADGKKGGGGGYRLARPAKEIRLGNIIGTLEGKTTLVRCTASGKSRDCPNRERCKTKYFWQKFQNLIDKTLDSVTLEDLLNNNF